MAHEECVKGRDAAFTTSGLEELLSKPGGLTQARAGLSGVAVCELLALLDHGRTPILSMRSHAEKQTWRARTTVDLHSDHIGCQVVVLFENDDHERPIVIGVVRGDRTAVPQELTGTVNVSADGERMVVTARRELVLECGRASLTLQQDGTIRIVGERILSQATGPNRVQGGSVELN